MSRVAARAQAKVGLGLCLPQSTHSSAHTLDPVVNTVNITVGSLSDPPGAQQGMLPARRTCAEGDGAQMTEPQYGPTPQGWGPVGEPQIAVGAPKPNWVVRHKITSTVATALLLLLVVGIANFQPPPTDGVVSPAAATSTALSPQTTTTTPPSATSQTTTAVAPTTTVEPTTTVDPVPVVTTTVPAPAPAPVAPAPVAPAAPAPAPAAPAPAPAPAPGGGACGADSYVNSSGNCVHDPVAAPSPPPGATALCNDGTYSFSQHHSGTCSSHKGVAHFYT